MYDIHSFFIQLWIVYQPLEQRRINQRNLKVSQLKKSLQCQKEAKNLQKPRKNKLRRWETNKISIHFGLELKLKRRFKFIITRFIQWLQNFCGIWQISNEFCGWLRELPKGDDDTVNNTSPETIQALFDDNPSNSGVGRKKKPTCKLQWLLSIFTTTQILHIKLQHIKIFTSYYAQWHHT